MRLQDMIIATIEDGKERNINRRMNLGYGQVSELRSCWHVSFNNNIFTLAHWGTDILVYDCKNASVTWALITSKSDSDGIQLALDYLSDGMEVHYYPSKDYGTIVNSNNNTIVYQGQL